MSILETIRTMREKRNYSMEELGELTDKIENELGAAEMWNILKKN